MSSSAVLAVPGACFAVSLGISAALTPAIRRWAQKRDFVDRPLAAGHKQHKRPVAFGGGIAITVAILLPLVAALVAAVILRHVAPEGFPRVTARLPSCAVIEPALWSTSKP